MTAFFKNRAVGQIDKVLYNGKDYTVKEIIEMIKRCANG